MGENAEKVGNLEEGGALRYVLTCGKIQERSFGGGVQGPSPGLFFSRRRAY